MTDPPALTVLLSATKLEIVPVMGGVGIGGVVPEILIGTLAALVKDLLCTLTAAI